MDFADGVLLALDLGAVRIGVAACDEQRILAYPVETLLVGDDIEDRIANLVEEYSAQALIVGYPIALDGKVGIAAQKIEHQAQQLAARVSVPVWLVDERMSSAEAHNKLRSAGRNAKKSRDVVDAQAAVGILELVLYALRQGYTIGREVEIEEAHG